MHCLDRADAVWAGEPDAFVGDLRSGATRQLLGARLLLGCHWADWSDGKTASRVSFTRLGAAIRLDLVGDMVVRLATAANFWGGI